jgi:quercetin dioxygenase-like cupin family protein
MMIKPLPPTITTVYFSIAAALLCTWGGSSTRVQDPIKPGTFPGPTESVFDYNETILQLDLSKEIDFQGRVLRMHYATMAPNGIIGQHSHADRPTIEYVLHGVATETKKNENGTVVVKSVAANETETSTIGITHWWKNQSNTMVRIMAVDIWKGNASVVCRPQGNPRTEPLQAPANPDNIKTENIGSLDLAAQLPAIPAAKDYVMRSRRLTLLPKQKTKLENGAGNPSITYVVKGEVWENRSDEASSIRRTGEYSVSNNGISYYWENTTIEPVVLWVVDIVKKGAAIGKQVNTKTDHRLVAAAAK